MLTYAKNVKLIGEKFNFIFLQVDNSTFSVEVMTKPLPSRLAYIRAHSLNCYYFTSV
jgi:hypothetical protein